jgi:cobalt-zinc-cadmium efflux system protein
MIWKMHNHNYGSIRKNLLIAIILNSVIVVAQIAGGFLSNSLALISDALHNLGDLFALVLSYTANYLSIKSGNNRMSFGFLRSEIIAAFINSSLLILIGAYIVYEGIIRINSPEPIAGGLMIIVAAIGFLANAFSAYLLHKDSAHNLNVKSSYLHLFYDAIHSLVVVFVGVLIFFFNWVILDSISSIVIGLFIVKSAWNVVSEATSILNEGVPKEINPEEVEKELRKVEGVKDIHHIHIWKLASNFIALSAHVVVDDRLVSEGYLIISRIEKVLIEKFGINHPTIQLEAEIKNSVDLRI